MAAANIALVQSLYAAFGRGDIGTIVAAATPDVVWGLDGRPSDIPMLGHHKGQSGVQDFFRLIDETHQITEFTPEEFYADRDKVFALGTYGWTMRKSGRKGKTEWLHVFTIRDGKVSGFRSLNDTALLAEAYRG